MSDNLVIEDSCPCGANFTISGYSSMYVQSIHDTWLDKHSTHRGTEMERLSLQLEAEKRINAAVQETITSIVNALSGNVTVVKQ